MIGSSKIGLRPIRGGGGGAAPNPDFVSTWDTTQAGSASDTIVLPLLSGGTYSGTIDWGDGNSDSLSYANRSHTYASSGTKTITISGDIGDFSFEGAGDTAKIIEVSNWGNLHIDTRWAFRSSVNLVITATDAPTLTTTNANLMFFNCDSLTDPDFSQWDVSSISNFSSMFTGCALFNTDSMANWDTSSGTNFSSMFSSCPRFNGDVSGFDFSSTTSLFSMFNGATDFNQDVSMWDVSGISNFGSLFRACSRFNQPIGSWNMSSSTRIDDILNSATDFNKPLLWNTSLVTNMASALRSMSAFDQDISSWDINQVSSFSLFMHSTTLSTTNYDALLIAWDAQGAMSYSGTVTFGSSQYTSGGAAETARTSLISKWGAIVDGGAA
jgi:hypothetical protein